MTPPPEDGPVAVWRISSALTLALLVIAAALLSVAIYLRPSPLIRLVVGGIGLAFALGGLFASRQLVYADVEEVIIRRVRGARSYRWDQIAGVDVVQTGKTGMTLALELVEGPQVLIPPSLVLPATPHSLAGTHSLLSAKARQLRAVGGLRND